MKRALVIILLILQSAVYGQNCGTIICRDTSICSEGSNFDLNQCSPPYGTYSGRGTLPGTTDSTFRFSREIAGEGTDTLTYVHDGDTCRFHINVVKCRDTSVCITSPPFELKLCYAYGGHYLGKGIVDYNNRTFDPSQAGLGIDTLKYFFDNGDTCFSYITVKANPTCHDTTVCINKGPFSLTLGAPESGTYIGRGVNAQGTFNPEVAGPGPATVKYFLNTCDTCTFIITVNDIPHKPGPIVGNTNVCRGEIGRYQVPVLDNAEHYNWTYTGGSLPNSQTDTSFIDILFTNNLSSGWLTVRGENYCAESKDSVSIYIKINEVPAASIRVFPDNPKDIDSVCMRQKTKYTLISTSNLNYIEWQVKKGTIDGDKNGPSVNISWGNQPGIDTLWALVRNTDGCEAMVYQRILISDKTAPAPATLWRFGCDMLVCSDSTAACIQWFKDGLPYDGFIAPSGRYILDTLNQSSYFVVTCSDTPDCECCNSSTPYQAQKMSGCATIANSMSIYPNPASDAITVKLSGEGPPGGELTLFNQYGIVIKTVPVENKTFRVDLTSLPAGLYFLQFLDKSGLKYTAKTVKL